MFSICVFYLISNKGWINWEFLFSGKIIIIGKLVIWLKYLFLFRFFFFFFGDIWNNLIILIWFMWLLVWYILIDFF